MDDIDRDILALMVEDGRRTFADIGGRVGLSAPAVKRRVDRLKASGALIGVSAVIDYESIGWGNEALIELMWVRGTTSFEVAKFLESIPNVIEAWAVTGDSDIVARVRTKDAKDLESLLGELQGSGLFERTRSSIVLRQLVRTRRDPTGP